MLSGGVSVGNVDELVVLEVAGSSDGNIVRLAELTLSSVLVSIEVV